MESFDLRQEFNKLLSDLNETTGKKNIFKLGIDIRLPEHYQGNLNPLVETTKKLSAFLANCLVNGIIQIEITSQARFNEDITLFVQISGRGNNRLTTSDKNQLEILIYKAGHEINHTISEGEIRFNFKQSVRPVEVTQTDPKLPFYKKKILLAEDNEINAMVFSSFLEEWGCENTMAINGEEAVNLAHEKEFDVILMDIFMPVLNGNQATKKIREFNSKIPIIALTASTLEDDIREAMTVGANDYLLKPVSSSHLFQVLSKYI